jgi:membrane peptidoglycan carboxypeptidase
MGEYIPQTYILKINDARGKVLKDWSQPKPKQVLKPDTAYIINDILSDPNASYLRKDRKFHNYKGWKFAIKTGTTNDAKDGLMVSYSTQYASAVWVGYHNRQKEMTGSMENMTQPIVQGWMRAAHDPIKPVNWTKPADVKLMPAYVIRSKISSQAEVVPSPNQDLFPSWYKQTAQQNSSTAQVIDKVSGKLATSCTPELAKENQNNSNSNVFSVDIFTGKKATATTTAEQDNIHNCSDAKPQITLTAPDTCSVTCAFTVTVTNGTHALSSDKFPGSVDLYVNGQKVQAQAVAASPSTITFNYTPTGTGAASVEARVTDSVLYTSSMSANVTFQ